MTHTSATGGYLQPNVATPPLEDASLDQQFQMAIAGMTGLDGSLVRPRWQPVVPKQPEPSVNWCAIGVMAQKADAGGFIQHHRDGDGFDEYVRHEDIEVACTFYGPNAQQMAAMVRDGIGIPQNIEGLNAVGISFVDCDTIRSVPEMFNQQWVKRYDLMMRFRRKVNRVYPILNILSADPEIISDEIGII